MRVWVQRRRGLLTVQDPGRRGHAHLGVPPGGWVDAVAARLANRLVGNAEHGPVLEWSLNGPVMGFGEPSEAEACSIALTGAVAEARLDGTPLPHARRVLVRAGQRLTFGRTRKGVYGYLAIAGEWSAERWLGSVSPLQLGTAAWPQSSVLAADAMLPVEAHSRPQRVYAEPRLQLLSELAVKLVYPDVDSARLTKLCARSWGVGRSTNRMGIRLVTAESPPLHPGSIASVPVEPGTMQWLPDGTLNIVGVDGQTTGGYPRVGWMDPKALRELAQRQPGEAISLRVV